MRAIRVPSLAENVNEVTVRRWLVAEGERVAVGDGLVELITEKAEFVLEVEEDGGVVTALLAPPKTVFPVGAVLCLLDGTDGEAEEARRENTRLCEQHLNASTVSIATDRETRSLLGAAPGVRATPAARRLAKERDVDLVELVQTFRIEGPVKEEDVRQFLERQS